jgi:SAM-dependent methyltransferase
MLHDAYEWLLRCSWSEQPFAVPTTVERYFVNPYAYEYVEAIRRFVGDAHRVLVIGDGGGRDFYSLQLLGKQPVVMDIARQPVIPTMIIADANAPLPFGSGTFDAVVMAEVVEHLPNDFGALEEARRILKDSGKLVLTVPYFHDAEPTHIRIHSPASIERLLLASGWRIVESIEKGGGLCRVVQWTPVRALVHFCNALLWVAAGKTAYHPFYQRVAAVDFWLGRKRRSLHRWSKFYGAFICCRRADPVDWSELNRRVCTNMSLGSSVAR